MNRSARFPVILVSLLLFIYCICVLTGWGLPFAELFFIFSPLLVIWMVLSVIRSKGAIVPELKEDQEWGYADKEF
jgi:hypothetical protein